MTRLVGERSPAPGPSSAGRIDAVQARAAVDEDLPGPGLRSATVAAATELAFDLLGDEQQRWQHTRAVVERAGQAADILPEQDVTALLAAAWLHDIGYAPTLRETGFHPLDGAAYLAELGWAPLVSSLVAHHSAARYAAAVAGLARPLGRYDDRAAVAGPLGRLDLGRPDDQPHRPDCRRPHAAGRDARPARPGLIERARTPAARTRDPAGRDRHRRRPPVAPRRSPPGPSLTRAGCFRVSVRRPSAAPV